MTASVPEVRKQQQQSGNYRYYRITEQVDGMPHFFTISLNHRLQFFDFFRRNFSLVQAIQAIKNCQHPDNKIDTYIPKLTILTQLNRKQ
jgi:hypothetical protein